MTREFCSPEGVQGHKGRREHSMLQEPKEVWFGQKEKQSKNMKARKDGKEARDPKEIIEGA